MGEVDIQLLKTAVPYIREYKEKIFVIKLSGEICQPGKSLTNLTEQIALLYQLGIKLVLVHGGGKQADELSQKLGIESEAVNGRRITSKEMLEVAKMSFAGTTNTDLVAALNAQYVPAIGISGIDGQLIKARKRPPVEVHDSATGDNRTVDFGYVADIDSVNTDLLMNMIEGKGVPVICSLVSDENGQVLNINADDIASHLTDVLRPTKYCLLSQVDGVMTDINDATSLISELTLEEAEKLLKDGTIQGGMYTKVQNCLDILKRGVPRAHIINGLSPDALLKEIFTNEGCGTLIVQERS